MLGNFNKIFCLGLSRTGTTSLHEAFLDLGLRSVHYPIHLFSQPEAMGLPPFRPSLRLGLYNSWRRGKELKASRFHHDAKRILESNDAFCDLPVPLFYKELDCIFPGSKFVLTTRDPEGWLKSMEWLFDDGGVLWKRGHLGDELHHQVYGTTVFDREKLLSAWERHHREVAGFFAHRSDDCLLLSVDRGELRYENLAAFLGISTARTGEVPRANEARLVDTSARRSLLIGKILLPFRLVFRRLFGWFAL
jgi:hypothetical protein